jgi:3-hydroxyisobutyrate dehydrogenase
MCEALLFAARMGVDPRKMLEAVGAGAATSWAIQNLAPKVVARDFRPGFKIAHQQKDLRLALELARQGFTPLPGTALVHQLFAALEAEGLGAEGTQALVKALEKLANASLRGSAGQAVDPGATRSSLQ